MSDFIVKDGKLIAYMGNDRIIRIPDGVAQIGGLCEDDTPRIYKGDPIGYKAFFKNKYIEDVFVPDSVEVLGFKCFEHCVNLRKISFSSFVKSIECNALGCRNLSELEYRGRKQQFEMIRKDFFSNFSDSQSITIFCNDGVLEP